MSENIRLLIADDHIIVRNGIRLLLEAERDLVIVGEAVDGKEAIEMAASLQPDIVLMDISMDGMDGLEATREIKAKFPDIQILVLTMHRSDEYFFEMIKAGASGYILKGAETNDLKRAIRMIADGGVFLYPTMVQKLIKGYVEVANRGQDANSPLSPRELEIMKYIAEGYSNQEIADILFISPSTVHTHRSNVMTKLGLAKRHELVKYARDKNLI